MAVKPAYYETLYLTRPDLPEGDLAKIQQRLQDSISSNQGEIIKADKWAEKELAYEIQDHKRGVYYMLVFKALPAASKEIEKHLQFYKTDVLRFMTIKITEEAANKAKTSEDKSEKAEPTTPTAPTAPPAPASSEETVTESEEVPTSTQEGGTE